MFTEKKLKKSPFTWSGYSPLKIVKEKAKEAAKLTILQKIFPWTKPKKPRESPTKYHIYAGPLTPGHVEVADLVGYEPSQLPQEYTKIIEDKYTPNPQLSVFDHTTKSSLTAAQVTEKRDINKRWMPQYFQNPLQSYDYIVYESLVKNSLLGPVMRTLIKFIMGTGFRPELELKVPSNEQEKDAELIDKNEEIVSRLLQVDRAVTEKAGVDGIDISFKIKMTNMIQNMLIYNRACAVFVYDTKNPVEIDGKKFPNIPVNLVDFHPKDMGLVKISPESHKMTAIQINQIQGFVNTEEMIYLWNSEYAAPIHNAKYYGGSMMMPMIDAARVIRSTISSILPSINENMVGGLYHIFIEPQGGTEAQKKAEYESITQATDYGTSNVFMIDPERVKYENVNFDPKIQEIIAMQEMLVKYVLANANVPQIGFFDEAAANHATAVEKIQLTISTVINPMREWIGDEIARQWYNRIFAQLYKEDSEERKTFRIKVAFDDLQVETLKERAEGLEILERRKTLTDEKAGEILQIDGYEDAIDTDAMPVSPQETFEVENEQEKFKVTEKTKQVDMQTKNKPKPNGPGKPTS